METFGKVYNRWAFNSMFFLHSFFLILVKDPSPTPIPITTLLAVFSSAVASPWQRENTRLHGDETQASTIGESASRSPGSGTLLTTFKQFIVVAMLQRKTMLTANGFTVKAAMKNSVVSVAVSQRVNQLCSCCVLLANTSICATQQSHLVAVVCTCLCLCPRCM